MNNSPLPVRLGEVDTQCRYPVIIGADGDGQVIGKAFRWHRNWLVTTTAGEHNLGRPPKGNKGIDMATSYLAEEYAAGRLSAVPPPTAEATAELCGPVPLLHPRMPATPRNISQAHTAFAGLTEHYWKPVATGFPGSDNAWFLLCELCGWSGVRYWSHHRGRNGNPPSAHRHNGGCIGKEKVRALIAAYQR
ncbi:hypothetical protein [Streptomyces sp. NPDC056987]|uniref:hypothetical protein n=1 Tax=Streptomyces sp. NPDC056987 TaxID=3345988 RepID=UPI00362BDF16